MTTMQPPRRSRRFVVAGLLLGVGLGGFLDGIVFHQILQWHHMLTSTGEYPATTVAGLEANTLADGLFHAAAWVAVAVGMVVLWPVRGQGTGRGLVGLLLVGWGAFNLIEGSVNHHLLGLHHVRAGPWQLAYDLGFLALGAVLLVAGWALHNGSAVHDRQGRTVVDHPPTTPESP